MNIIQKCKKYLRSPRRLILALGTRGWFKKLPDKLYLELVYWGEMGKKLNLENPITYNEKLQWLKLHDRNPEYCIYVDKYEVRSYIRETIGEQYLKPLLGIYKSTEEINWNSLPDKFVLKCTHGSGANVICTDKEKLNIKEAKIKLDRWMKKNWYWSFREWPYKKIEPKIICEPFLSETDKLPEDYKVHCFNGKAKIIAIAIDRNTDLKYDYYDRKWEKTTVPMRKGEPIPDTVHQKPKQFETMIQLSEKLASDIRYVRIDWFIVKEKLYFGEITFYELSGLAPFEKKESDYLLGDWINLSEK